MLSVINIAIKGIIAGANMVLVDIHPDPASALVDGPQALEMDELEIFIDDINIVRDAYLARCALVKTKE